MVIYNEEISITSNGRRVSYHDITEEVEKCVQKSAVVNGFCLISSPHTTCSVIFEEFMHDTNYNGDELLQVDLNNILEKIVPRCVTDGQYYHPGPKHKNFCINSEVNDEKNYPSDISTLLNTDAHLRSTILGSNVSFPIVNSVLKRGKVGYVYFVDFDQNRSRSRACNVFIMGESEV